MKVTIAYIEEPPFGWTDADGNATGADIELADAVLRAIGVTRIEHRLTTFSELLPGVQAGRWQMNVPLFVTPRSARSRSTEATLTSRCIQSAASFISGLAGSSRTHRAIRADR